MSPEKVVNVRCGVGPEYHPEVEPYHLSFPYLLCVSNRKGHKNELRVVESFALSCLATDMWLVFTGSPTTDLMNCVNHYRLTQRVRFLGVVPDRELPSLYRSAEALVFPSLYEGFGLPVLEAMACGTPVVTANTTALPEVAGDAALLVDPTSVEQISAAMQQIVNDSPLRRQLRERGLSQAAQFSWARTVAQVHELLVECCNSCG